MAMKRLLLQLAAALLLTSSASAALPGGLRDNANMRPRPALEKVAAPDHLPVDASTGATLPPYDTVYYFDQLIDHSNPSLGTFQQRYWHTWEWYKSGGPIILMTPGETNADGYEGYLTNVTINGMIAQQQGGATVLIEHRFFGLSNPRPNLTVESLQLLTLNQSIADLAYFAETVDLPMPGGDAVQPGKAPWVLIGGSYSGALTAWTMTNTTDVFYAAYASSAVVEAKVDYWAYFEPIREYMPQNCSADVEAVIAHVDSVFTGTNQTAINELKALFGMQNLTHLDDVAGALRNNLWDWQSLQPFTGPDGQFFQFCDALEVKNGVSASASGWGLEWALNAWGSYFKNVYYSYLCGDQDVVTCLGTYNPDESYFTDVSVNNDNRSWMWFVCNYLGYLQEGPPAGKPAIVTRLVQPIYDERQCTYYFPSQFPHGPQTPAASATNAIYHGWDVRVDRLFFANGQRDPWRDVTLSADNLTLANTTTQPVFEGDAFHCSDLLNESSVDPTVARVQQAGLKYMKTWLADWTPTEEKRDISSRIVRFD